MPGLSKVIVLDPDARAGRLLRLGFEREGVPVEITEVPGEDTGLVVVGGGLEQVRQMRARLAERKIDAPIVFTGRSVTRGDAEAAGADEVVLTPAFLRDVVTVGRILRGVPAAQRTHVVGNLAEITGVFTLVRALAALGRSATLTLVRGLRRGEIRFYHGEVTSAQVGMIHGQAALHQLLLWTDARFDFHHEDIVRRQQIPLSPDELFADAARFLEGVRDSSGGLSPSAVLEQDLPRVQSFGKQIPTEVYGVLRMFDGHRVLADVLEDSAYRVFETLRVTQRAVEIGLLRAVDKPGGRAAWRTVLAIEDWLVGAEPRDAVVDSGPVAAAPARDARTKSPSKKRRKKKRRAETPVAVPAGAGAKEIDWGALVPRTVGAEVGPLAGVVPAAQVAGEIAQASAASEPRTASEPKVVFDASADAAAKAAADQADADAAAKSAADEADAEAKARAADDLRIDDTKPERVLNRATLQGVADGPTAELSGATTTRTTAQGVAVAAASPIVDVSGAVTKRTTVPDAAALDVREANTLRVAVVPPPSIAPAPPGVAAPGSAPAEITDEASDGVIIQHITTAETAPARRRRLPSDPPEDDRPDDAMGEITAPRQRTTAEPRGSEPSILIADLADELAREPSILVADQPAEPAAAPKLLDDRATVPLRVTPAKPTPAAATAEPAALAKPAPAAAKPAPAAATAERAPAAATTKPASAAATAKPAPVKPVKLTSTSPGPAVLVADLAAVHSAVSAVAVAQAAAPASPDATSAKRDAPAAAARSDAASFSEAEEAFFRAGHERERATTAPHIESFDDLDEGYRPVGFWDRLRGKRPPRTAK